MCPHSRLLKLCQIFAGKEHRYVLQGDPKITDDNSIAQADTIIYYDELNKVELIQNARYKDDKQDLKSYRIDYQLDTDEFTTVGESEVTDEEGRLLKASRIFRDELGNNIAEENMSFKDTVEAMELLGDMLVHNSELSSYKTFNKNGQPILVKEFDLDSLLLKSDTLYFLESKNPKDSSTTYMGENNVRFVKGDIAGIAEHLFYNSRDSIFRFTGNPVLWSDSMQIMGDTLLVKLNQDEMEYLKVIGNAFMIMQSEFNTFDQVKGDEILNSFVDNELRQSKVSGNVEMVYFMYENEKLEGINHSLCGGMSFFFEDEEIKNISFSENNIFSCLEVYAIHSPNKLMSYRQRSKKFLLL